MYENLSILPSAIPSTFSRFFQSAPVAIRKKVEVIKDSYGRRKIQRKPTPYKGYKKYQQTTARLNFYDKVRATHSNLPETRDPKYVHAHARRKLVKD